jgi:CHAT domain-containing protein
VGDPRFAASDAPWPEKGALVRELAPDGQAAALGLRPGDVLVRYGAKEVADLASLRAALGSEGGGAGGTVPLRFVREGEERAVDAKPGRLGVVLATEPPPVSGPALVAGRPATTFVQGGALRPLPGTRDEVAAIREAFAEARVVTLLGADATEARLFDEAKGARHLHLATHGIVDERESASFRALALARPCVPVPGDDGFLTLADLLARWRGRLDGTALVVLSACDSQKGRVDRHEGAIALPLGFWLAGAPAVVASLWEVPDRSTALLMADFYRRLRAEGAGSPCEALHAAKRELRKTHPDPLHWAAFVYVGAP